MGCEIASAYGHSVKNLHLGKKVRKYTKVKIGGGGVVEFGKEPLFFHDFSVNRTLRTEFPCIVRIIIPYYVVGALGAK